MCRLIHRRFQVPVEVCRNSAIRSAKRKGDFGLTQSFAGDFSDLVSTFQTLRKNMKFCVYM